MAETINLFKSNDTD